MNINSINPVREEKNYSGPVAKKENTEKNGTRAASQSNSNETAAVAGKKELADAVESSNKIGQLLHRKLSFDIDESTEKIVVKVIDEESGDIVRQIPPEEMLRISAHLKKLQDMNDQVMRTVKSVILDVSV